MTQQELELLRKQLTTPTPEDDLLAQALQADGQEISQPELQVQQAEQNAQVATGQAVNKNELLQKLYADQQAKEKQRQEVLRYQIESQLNTNKAPIDFTPLAATLNDFYGVKGPQTAVESYNKDVAGQQTRTNEVFDKLAEGSKGNLGAKDLLSQQTKDARTSAINDRGQLAAGKIIDSNPLINQFNKQSALISNDLHTLETSPIITHQILTEITNGFALAIAGGGQSSESSREKQEWDSYSQDLTKLQQKVLNNPQDIGSPQVKQYLIDLGYRLNDAYARSIEKTAKRLATGYNLKAPGAQDVLNAKVGAAKAPPPHVSKAPVTPKKAAPQAAAAPKVMSIEEADAALKALGH